MKAVSKCKPTRQPKWKAQPKPYGPKVSRTKPKAVVINGK